MVLRLFGLVHVYGDDGGPVDVPGGRQRRLFERLCLDLGEPVPAASLVEAVWGDETLRHPDNALKVLVSRLRATLADVPGLEIEHADGGYRMTVDRARVDLGLFEMLAMEGLGLGGASEGGRMILQEALRISEGVPYAGFEATPRLDQARGRIEVLRRRVADMVQAAVDPSGEPPAPSRFRPVEGRAPAPADGVLVRPRLMDRLTAAPPGGVIVVTAPAGSGKTSLLRAFAETRRAVVWLDLTPAHDDPARLRADLLARSAIHWPAAPWAGTGDAPTSDLDIEELTEMLAVAAPDGLLIVLDDAHVVSSPAAIDQIRRMARGLPLDAVLAVAGRRTPPIGLGQLRLRRCLVDIRGDDLRVDDRELTALLRARGHHDDASSRGVLLRATDGWIPAVALTISGRAPVEGTGGIPDVVLDYVVDEILAELPAELLRFLEQLSPFERFDVDMAAEISGRADASSLLDELVVRDLFVHTDGTTWWFDEVLRAGVVRRAAIEWSDLGPARRRAAAILERTGDLEAALALHAAVGDRASVWRILRSPSATAPVLDRTAARSGGGYALACMESGRSGSVRPYFDLLLDDPPELDPHLFGLAAGIGLGCDNLDTTRRAMAKFNEGWDWRDPPESLLVGIGGLEAWVRLSDGDIEGALDAARTTVAVVTASVWKGSFMEMPVRRMLVEGLFLSGALDDAEDEARRVIAEARALGTAMPLVGTMAGLIALLRGDTDEADAHIRSVVIANRNRPSVLGGTMAPALHGLRWRLAGDPAQGIVEMRAEMTDPRFHADRFAAVVTYQVLDALGRDVGDDRVVAEAHAGAAPLVARSRGAGLLGVLAERLGTPPGFGRVATGRTG